jgi:adenylate kinase
MKIVFLGPPGAGKGTQAEVIVKRLGIPQISTGEILRRAIREKTQTGLEAQSYIEKGALVPDDVVVRIVRDRLQEADCQGGYLLDGFPRTLAQAEALDTFEKIDAVINLEVPQDLLIHRLSGRRVCANCGYTTHVDRGEEKCPKCSKELTQRKDDAPESVKNRLVVYEEQTKPLIDYYAERGLLKNVDGAGALADVSAAILAALGCN